MNRKQKDTDEVKHCGRVLGVVQRGGKKCLVPLKSQLVMSGAPPAPETKQEVMPVLKQIASPYTLLSTDRAGAYIKTSRDLKLAHFSVSHSNKQFSRLERIPANKQTKEQGILAQKRQLESKKKTKKHVQKKPSLRFTVCTNAVEGLFGNVKDVLRRTARLKSPKHSLLETLAAAHLLLHPGTAATAKAYHEYACFWASRLSPQSFNDGLHWDTAVQQ